MAKSLENIIREIGSNAPGKRTTTGSQNQINTKFSDLSAYKFRHGNKAASDTESGSDDEDIGSQASLIDKAEKNLPLYLPKKINAFNHFPGGTSRSASHISGVLSGRVEKYYRSNYENISARGKLKVQDKAALRRMNNDILQIPPIDGSNGKFIETNMTDQKNHETAQVPMDFDSPQKIPSAKPGKTNLNSFENFILKKYIFLVIASSKFRKTNSINSYLQFSEYGCNGVSADLDPTNVYSWKKP